MLSLKFVPPCSGLNLYLKRAPLLDVKLSHKKVPPMLSVKLLSKKAPMLCIRFLPRKKSDVKRKNLYPKRPS